MAKRLRESDYLVAWVAFTASIMILAFFVMPYIRPVVELWFGGLAASTVAVAGTLLFSYAAFRFFVASLLVRKAELRLREQLGAGDPAEGEIEGGSLPLT